MTIKIGEVEALFRYPVKSMRGERVEEAALGWHGLSGDRRLALRRLEDSGGFPWLTASKLPEMILFTPLRRDDDGSDGLPSHVRTPEGAELATFGPELAAEVSRRHGQPVEMMRLDRGIFDEASVSAITTATVAEVARLAGHRPDVRRFRPNILISPTQPEPFGEDAWVGGLLSFGEGDDAAVIGVTNRDERCAMINYDPDSGSTSPELLATVVRERDNKAGIYGTVIRCGRLAVGQRVLFRPAVEQPGDRSSRSA
jgi:uncharacterized protein YcbX